MTTKSNVNQWWTCLPVVLRKRSNLPLLHIPWGIGDGVFFQWLCDRWRYWQFVPWGRFLSYVRNTTDGDRKRGGGEWGKEKSYIHAAWLLRCCSVVCFKFVSSGLPFRVLRDRWHLFLAAPSINANNAKEKRESIHRFRLFCRTDCDGLRKREVSVGGDCTNEN